MRSFHGPFAGLSVITLALALTACSGGGTPAGDDDTATSGEQTSAAGGASDEKVTLVLGTWRTEDTAMWEGDVIPAFEASHPNITVEYAPVDTNDYNATIQSQVQGGTGPDLIMCRPFDVNRAWISDGYFDALDDLDAVAGFSETARAAWMGDDGKTYCIPTASVLAGFYYNKAIFDELGLQVPTTQADLISVLTAIKQDGKYAPLALGSADGWQLAYNVLYNLGPTYWKGEEGRLGLIDGTKKLTDPEFVQAFQATADLIPYLPDGYQSISYEDMMQMFTLGKAAILPDGSWDITAATATGLEVGVFAPPVANEGDQRYLQEMPDMGIGLNAASTHKDAAKQFLEWLGTSEFQALYVNKLPGFFSMGSEPITYDNALAQEFAGLKDGAVLTPRLALDRLSAGTPPLDDETWRVLQLVFNSGTSPQDATAELQAGLDSWYTPAK